MIRVVIVDDEPDFIKLFHYYLAEACGISIVGEASNGTTGLELVKTLSPDAIITDMNMPDMTGLDVIRAVAMCYPETKSILTSGNTDPGYLSLAEEEGAIGFIPKTQLSAESILQALESEA
ncbi:MAG: response regulator transcription factor [SAR202 cluster bacterium]|jgi:YesN/AraC family two-component response regulator|nr:response regulator transcription factor [SAR202 cluster bacterium]MDP6513886.1 response regulator transcription factor [SAR202 cluster bacterium]MDP6715317.1 response regulator transcription factor [SAR202 cluster bacterium]